MRVLFLFLLLSLPAHAHESHDYGAATLNPVTQKQYKKEIEKFERDGYLYIISNGIPGHPTGEFPNQFNPHAITPQKHAFRVPLTPTLAPQAEMKEGIVGIAVNGIPFEPGTAECYRPPYGWIAGDRCEWREEAIVKNKRRLGLDDNNGHVQPNGMYHYHGIPKSLISAELTHVGYAADGFRMIVSRSGAFKSSYRLKRGFRASGPGGPHNGRYTADFEYKKGSGDLDACNGTTVNGEYVYVITAEFPFLPRCLAGISDESFEQERRPDRSRQRPRGAIPPVAR